jgi:hypothetical protein
MPINPSGPCPQPQDFTIPKLKKESLEKLKDKLACKPPDNNMSFQYIKKGNKENNVDK